MDVLDHAIRASRRWAATFFRGSLAAPPARRLVVLACMDARLDPVQLFGLELGDAHVIRNAGGRASDDALRSLAVSATLLGTRTVLVVHHTDCGLMGLSNEELRRRFAATGVDTSGVDFLPFTDLDESVRADVRRIRACPLLPREMTVTGFVYDVRTGRLAPVAGAEP